DRGQGPEADERQRRAREDPRGHHCRQRGQRRPVQGRQGQGVQRAGRPGDEGDQGQGQSAAGERPPAQEAGRV
ncbi:MAG: Aspartyl-tRNA(Asn) amidotransferase subunit B @ Glutamyl-tRNA(Gln) amidotransferase subunit B, partial [uncultured Ramlibacter sp.]